MKLDGEVTINADRQMVWDFLTNPEAVSQCAPGLESMKIIEPDKQFEAVAALGFGTVKMRFVTDVRWVELDAPKFAKMTWSADILVSGTITSLASRMMGSVSKKIANSFFDCVRGYLEDGTQ